MKTRSGLFSLAVAAVLVAASASPSQAYNFGWGGYGWPMPFGTSIYSQDYIPYFARHPPVYYSYPTYYRYGRTPYAAWPDVGGGQAAPSRPQPLVVINQYVQGEKPTATVATPQPLVVQNPYYDGPLVADAAAPTEH